MNLANMKKNGMKNATMNINRWHKPLSPSRIPVSNIITTPVIIRNALQNERRFLFAPGSIITKTAAAIFIKGTSISSSVSNACFVSMGFEVSSKEVSGRNAGRYALSLALDNTRTVRLEAFLSSLSFVISSKFL